MSPVTMKTYRLFSILSTLKFIFPILTVGYKKYYQLVNTGNTVRSFIQ